MIHYPDKMYKEILKYYRWRELQRHGSVVESVDTPDLKSVDR